MTLRALLDDDQRLVILRSLIECGGDANESVLQTCLDTYGHRLSRDGVRAHLAWLDEIGLVRLATVSGCMVAAMTGRGQDVAEGRVHMPGVKRPRFGG